MGSLFLHSLLSTSRVPSDPQKIEMDTRLQAYPDVLQSKSSSAERLNGSVTLSMDEKLGEQISEEERRYTFWRAIVAHRRILLHSVAAFAGGMVFGYDTIANGATISMPGFMLFFGARTESGSLFIPSIWASLWTAMSNLLQAIGGFLIGFATDRLGRKWPCVGACVISIIGVGVQYGAQTRAILLVGKMINGFAVGCILATSTAWASEISPLRLRGPIQSAIVLFEFFMQAIGLVIVRVFVPNLGPSSFKTVFAIQWIAPALTAILFCFMPESPPWLVLRGRIDDARTSLARLHGSSNQIDARLAHLALGVHLEEEEARRNGAGSYVDLFRDSNLKRSLTVIWMFLGFGLTGACLLAQSIYFLIIAGLRPIHAYDVSIGGFGLAVVCIIFSWMYMEKAGRRSIFLIGAAGNCIAMFVIGGLYYSDRNAALWAVAIIMFVHSLLYICLPDLYTLNLMSMLLMMSILSFGLSFILRLNRSVYG